MKKKIDILDFLPQEAIARVDEVGYSFLRDMGYETEGAVERKSVRDKIARRMKRRCETLVIHKYINRDDASVLVWFELIRRGKSAAVSGGVKFVPKTEVLSSEEQEGNTEGFAQS